jgi:rod shape-determining protein MreC
VIRFQPYRKKRSYLQVFFIALLALLLSFASLRNLGGIRSFLLSAIYPFQFVVVSGWKGITGFPRYIINMRALSGQNDRLNQEVNLLNSKLLVLDEVRKENQRLRAAHSFKQTAPYSSGLVVAQVIGKAPTPWFTILEINKGTRSGLKKNMPVISRNGLVGKIIEVSGYVAKVMLITDADSSIAAINARSRDNGVVAGRLSNQLQMKYVSAGGDIRPGDNIVTSPISTIYPPGIPIGNVSKASKGEHDLFYHIEIKPAVDFSKLEEVFVAY